MKIVTIVWNIQNDSSPQRNSIAIDATIKQMGTVLSSRTRKSIIAEKSKRLANTYNITLNIFFFLCHLDR